MSTFSLNNSIYIGSLDDKVTEYPWPFLTSHDNDYAMLQVLQNILIGRTVLITDIHLLLNKYCRNDLKKLNDSILFNLISAGAIKIPLREDTLEKVIHIQRGAGINSFLELDNQSIDIFCWLDEMFPNGSIGPRSPSSSAIWSGYHNLVNQATNKPYIDLGLSNLMITEEDWLNILEKFKELSTTNKTASRKEFEEAINYALNLKANTLSPNNSCKTKHSLMNFANELYHINFTACLSAQYNASISVETSIRKQTSHFFQKGKQEIPENFHQSILNIQDISYLFDLRNIERLFSTASNLGRARIEFSEIFQKFHQGLASFKMLSEAGRQYSELLKKDLVKPKRISKVSTCLSLCIAGIGAGIGMVSTSPISTFAMAGLFWITDRYIPKTLAGQILKLVELLKRNPIPLHAKGTHINSPLDRDFLLSTYSPIVGNDQI